MEIDWSVGEIVKSLRRAGVERDTLTIFISDNGPWLSYGDHSGRATPLREGKGTTWEGGVRVPCIMCWPGRIPPGSACSEPAMTIDLLPSVAAIIGADLPAHRLDGLDILPLMTGAPKAATPHEGLFFYWNNGLEAVRSGNWKLHFPHSYRTLGGLPGGSGGIPTKYRTAETGLALYDLDRDPGESRDVAAEHPDIVERLRRLGRHFDEDLQRSRREPGRLTAAGDRVGAPGRS
jgi:arylsulfatase A